MQCHQIQVSLDRRKFCPLALESNIFVMPRKWNDTITEMLVRRSYSSASHLKSHHWTREEQGTLLSRSLSLWPSSANGITEVTGSRMYLNTLPVRNKQKKIEPQHASLQSTSSHSLNYDPLTRQWGSYFLGEKLTLHKNLWQDQGTVPVK